MNSHKDSKEMKSLPLSRGSVVDSELSSLIRQFPNATEEYLNGLFKVDTRRYKRDIKGDREAAIAAVRDAPALRDQLEKSHYQATYIEKTGRPRSNKRPPPSPRQEHVEPMHFDTWQRDTYKIPEGGQRAVQVRHKDNHIRSEEPANDTTMYQTDYIVPRVTEETIGHIPHPQMRRRKGDDDKFYGETTNKATFKQWPVNQGANVHFGELPVFTGSILYPSGKHDLETEMKANFLGTQTQRVPLMKSKEPVLKPEGEHDFLTVQRESFQNRKGPIERPKPFPGSDNLVSVSKQPLMGITQFMHDYPGFTKNGGKQPQPPLPAKPAEATITLKRNDDSLTNYFQTEQRAVFKGHDVRDNPIPKPFKKDATEFKPPEETFHTVTMNKTDFIPLSLEDSPAFKPPPKAAGVKLNQKGNVIIPSGSQQFYGTTTNNEFFKNWKPELPFRHSDFHMSYSWVPPVHKLEGQSETRQSFPAKWTERVENLKPKPVPIASTGEQDFNTSYRKAFLGNKTKVHLSRQQAEMLKRQLLAKKMSKSAAVAVPVH